MTKSRTVFLVLLTLHLIIVVSGCVSENATEETKVEGEYARSEILVKFKERVSQERIEAINKNFQVEVIKVLSIVHVYHLRVPRDATVKEMVRKYENLPEVEYAEPNYVVKKASP